MIIDAKMEAPENITVCTLVSCCDHIEITCSNLVATNADMRKKLETGISMMPNPVEIYERTIEGKTNEVEVKK